MVDQYIQSVLDSNKNKEEVDRAVKDGDVVDIKYVGKKDGVEFDNGSSDSYELTIGSNTFIDGFEDGVIGMKKDETKDLNLTFPEDYNNTDLAGADVVFTVTVNHVYEKMTGFIEEIMGEGGMVIASISNSGNGMVTKMKQEIEELHIKRKGE